MSFTRPVPPRLRTAALCRWAVLVTLSLGTMASLPSSSSQAQAPDPCAPPNGNPVLCENALAGSPQTAWDIAGVGDDTIQGFATDISVNRGQTVLFKINTDATSLRLDIYRLGYYGGLGARQVATVLPSATLPQFQPDCLTDFSTGLVDCGNWAVSASWAVPATATSGIYLAKAIRLDTGGASHIVFIVRHDNRASDVLFQTDDTTWQAYNNYGGNSLYTGAPAGRAYKVSYNRPFNNRATHDGYGQPNWVFWGAYPMVRWLEANGFDVSYFTGVDAHRRGSQMLGHKVYMTLGHDEYWSGTQRANVEAARNSGVNLAFFTGNTHYWKTRFEDAIDGSNTPHRTLVSYKETLDAAKIDPSGQWTGTWRDPRFSPPSDGGRPENALLGTIFGVNRGPDGLAGTPIEVPAAEGKARLWRNTSVATQTPGQVAFLADNTLGYEWDEDLDNGFRPGGLIRLSSTTESVPEKLVQGYGGYEDFGPGVATHALTLYRHASGALVFSSATVQWSWGLDATHDGATSIPDVRMRQATVNLLADMGTQPKSLQAGLVAATASTDQTPPTAEISYPTNALEVPPGVPVTITGSAADTGGIVAGVEISIDNGQTWHPANGKASWSYVWTPTTTGAVQIRARAVDDTANIQSPAASVNVTVVTDTQAPQVSGRTPAPGATNVSAGTAVTATFNEVMSPASISTSTIELRTPANQLVPAVVSYNASTRTATLQPTATLAFSTSYTARVRGGSTGVKDFSGNGMTADVLWSFTTWAAPPCPCSIWDPATTVPTVIDSGDASSYELGVKFRADYDGFITGLRFYKSAGNTGTHTGKLWNANGTLLGSLTFTSESASGWQEAYFSSPVAVAANTVYVASYHAPNGHYSITSGFFSGTGASNSPLRAPGTGETPNGVFRGGASGFPDQSFNASNYWVDVVYLSIGGDTTAPTVTNRSPAPAATGVSAGATVSATFSEAMGVASLTAANFELRNAANQLVSGTISYAVPTRTATLQPGSSLGFNSTYNVRVRGGSAGVKDLAGNSLAADVTWTFTTGAPPVCPCSLFDPATAVPPTDDSGDGSAYELGVRFRSELDGYITGLRYYKSAANTGLHVANLWTSTGTLVATAQFVGETATGWQEVSFPSPVAIAAHTTYVASYHAPNGHYAFSPGYFASTGILRSPLYAPAASDGGNGVYKGGTSGFPSSTYNAANYWVDVIYMSVGGDVTPPTITGRTPANGATGVGAGSNVTVTFNEAMSPASITSATFELRNSANQLLPASVSFNGGTRTATLDPSAGLTFGATYSARVIGGASGVKDLFGNPLAADSAWSFTVGTAPPCPCSIWTPSTSPSTIDSGDGSSYELGVKFRADVDGFIAGVRFYKSSANTGVHVAHLWSSAGGLLATATFTSETASGWQDVQFSSPVAVSGGQTYVASYWAPNGHYSINGAYFASGGTTAGPLHAVGNGEASNGVFRSGSSGFPSDSWNAANYWVDVVFVVAGGDVTAPTVTVRTPAPGATNVSVSTALEATFSEAINPSTITTANVELRNSANQIVNGTVAYDAGTRRATLTPSATLTGSAVYTATVRGGSTGVRDVSGNALAADVVWTFTTGVSVNCPCSIWDATAVPATIDSGDSYSYELGVKFRTQVDGFITRIRFYKSAANTGTHVAHLWSSTGTLLATATFTSETASGWQEVTLPSPVPVTAGTTFVASYWVPNGRYSVNAGYFNAGGAGSGAVVALGNATSPNGVFRGGSSGFPTDTYNAGNYWVDVVFTTGGS